ncbi:MAG TPA: efflux RND transporter periplasmic adaptor subunit, partial [Candidatus Polarisedimenticolia bacterium]|nr:efflux RND transporter periplasmic adaptor subunit [Candidatus Polarisedimenticolia bacterium]
LGAGVLAAVLFMTRLELRIAGPFNVLPEENADVRSPLEQIIEEIYVDEGQIVKAGDRIARLDDRPLRAELARTDAAIEEGRAILRKLQVGATTAEIAVAKAGVAKGEDSLMYATRRVEKLAILYQQGLVSQKELEDAQEVASSAANNRTEAGSRLRLLEVGTRPEEIAATRARLEQLESQRRYLEEQRALLDIVSPVPGIVATPTRQLKELRRQLVKKGDLILKVYDVSTVTAQIFVSERELDGIEVGQQVELRARAYPGTTFQGTVTSIATSAQGSAGVTTGPGVFASGSVDPNKSVIVTTRIDNQSLLLKPEMTGQAKIFCGPRRIADLMARRVALTFRVALWSWW